MKTKIRVLLLDAVLVGMAFGAPSQGRSQTILPKAVWSGSVSGFNCASSLCGGFVTPVTGPGVTGSAPQYVKGVATPSPSIFASTAVSPISLPIDSRNGSSDAQLLYNIEVICSSKKCASTVPIGVVGIGAVSSTPGPIASSEVKLIVGTTTILDVNSINNALTVTPPSPGLTPPYTSAFSYSDKLSLVLSFIYTVELDADTSVATSAGAQSATAFIDPYFFVEASFPDLEEYSILVSPGIGNSPVPEPSTWALLLAGLAGVGFIAQRRPKKAAAL